jgi:hypothetical protein
VGRVGESRVRLPDRRDPTAYVQVTGHPERRAVTMSHWHGRVCVASAVVDVQELPELVTVLTVALARSAAAGPPHADARPLSAIALDRLRSRWHRPRAEVVELIGSAVSWVSRHRAAPGPSDQRAG